MKGAFLSPLSLAFSFFATPKIRSFAKSGDSRGQGRGESGVINAGGGLGRVDDESALFSDREIES